MAPAGAFSSYFPSMSVIVPLVLPFTSTFTPITGSPVVASITYPFNFDLVAELPDLCRL